MKYTFLRGVSVKIPGFTLTLANFMCPPPSNLYSVPYRYLHKLNIKTWCKLQNLNSVGITIGTTKPPGSFAVKKGWGNLNSPVKMYIYMSSYKLNTTNEHKNI